MNSVSLKLRISKGQATAMGPGKADLLDAIHAFGSISAAAKKMKMSYRRAWELVDVMNNCFNEPLVVSSTGGQHGGGAQLTEFGHLILKAYRDLVMKSQIAGSEEFMLITSKFNK